MKLNVSNAVGFTGTRKGMDAERSGWLERVLTMLSTHANEFHHGDCYGADTEAAHIARYLGFQIYAHPGPHENTRGNFKSDNRYEPLPYLERNQVIVDSTQFVVGVPAKKPSVRSGTLYTIRYAIRQEKLVIAYPELQFKQYG